MTDTLNLEFYININHYKGVFLVVTILLLISIDNIYFNKNSYKKDYLTRLQLSILLTSKRGTKSIEIHTSVHQTKTNIC